MLLLVGKLLVFTALMSQSALLTYAAQDNAERYATPPHVSEWYKSLMQPDKPTVPCCGEVDAYYADSFEVADGKYVAVITDERPPCTDHQARIPESCIPFRPHIPPGTRVLIPEYKLKYDMGNPTGHGIVFMTVSLEVLCYIVPGGV